MARMELSLTDGEKAMIAHAAEKEKLKPATWAKAKLLLLAQESMPMSAK